MSSEQLENFEELEALAAALRTSGITADDCRAVETLYAVAGHSGSHRIVQAMRYLRIWIERRPRILAKWPECGQSVARVGQNHKGDRAMMSEELETLARRAVACKHWRWMPGMIALDGCRVVCVYSDGYVYSNGESDGYQELAETDCSIPDLNNPATLGCFLALVRDVWGCPIICVSHYAGKWWLDLLGDDAAYGLTVTDSIVSALARLDAAELEAAVLVAALEAAP